MSRAIREERVWRERIVKELLFILFTMVLILGIGFFVCGTVVSKDEGMISVDEQYYYILEKEYVSEIRNYFEEQGFVNSGVNLTMVTDGAGNRKYSVEVYHKGICKLTEEEQDKMFEEVKQLAFQAVGCEFEVNLLI